MLRVMDTAGSRGIGGNRVTGCVCVEKLRPARSVNSASAYLDGSADWVPVPSPAFPAPNFWRKVLEIWLGTFGTYMSP